jgi:hypothetical protein
LAILCQTRKGTDSNVKFLFYILQVAHKAEKEAYEHQLAELRGEYAKTKEGIHCTISNTVKRLFHEYMICEAKCQLNSQRKKLKGTLARKKCFK